MSASPSLTAPAVAAPAVGPAASPSPGQHVNFLPKRRLHGPRWPRSHPASGTASPLGQHPSGTESPLEVDMDEIEHETGEWDEDDEEDEDEDDSGSMSDDSPTSTPMSPEQLQAHIVPPMSNKHLRIRLAARVRKQGAAAQYDNSQDPRLHQGQQQQLQQSPSAQDTQKDARDDVVTDPQQPDWLREMERARTLKAGWLYKKGEHGRKSWKRRWFVLRPTQLAYYRDEGEYAPLGIIMVRDIHSVTPLPFKRRPCAMAVVTRTRTYYLEAPVGIELTYWLAAFEQAVTALPAVPSVASLPDLASITAAINESTATDGGAGPPLAREASADPGSVTRYDIPITGSPKDIETRRRQSADNHSHANKTSDVVAPGGSGNSDISAMDMAHRRTRSTPGIGVVTRLGLSHDCSPHTGSPGLSDNEDDMLHSGLCTANTAPTPTVAESRTAAASVLHLPASVTAEIANELTHRNGWLWRYEHRGVFAALVPGNTRVWRRRWVVLRGNRLVVYKDEKEYSPLRIIHLTNTLDVLTAQDTKGFNKALPPSMPATPAVAVGLGGTSPTSPGEPTAQSTGHSPTFPPLSSAPFTAVAGDSNVAPAEGATPSGGSPPHPTTAAIAPPGAESGDVALGGAAATNLCFQLVATDKTYLFGAAGHDEMCMWVRDLRRLLRLMRGDQITHRHAGAAPATSGAIPAGVSGSTSAYRVQSVATAPGAGGARGPVAPTRSSTLPLFPVTVMTGSPGANRPPSMIAMAPGPLSS